MSSEFVIPYDIAQKSRAGCLYQFSKAWSKVWWLVHQAQFGPLHTALVAPSDHDHGWRDLVLQRVVVVHQDTLKITSLIVSQYRLHATIRYSYQQLQADFQSLFPGHEAPESMRGVTLPPFPTANWPELVFAVMGPCGPSAWQSTSVVKCVLQPLARLVLVTCHWSPNEHALPAHTAPMIHFAIVLAMHDIAEIQEETHGDLMVFGEDKLLMRASDASARGDTLGYDTTVFGLGHCDCIIAVTMGQDGSTQVVFHDACISVAWWCSELDVPTVAVIRAFHMNVTPPRGHAVDCCGSQSIQEQKVKCPAAQAVLYISSEQQCGHHSPMDARNATTIASGSPSTLARAFERVPRADVVQGAEGRVPLHLLQSAITVMGYEADAQERQRFPPWSGAMPTGTVPPTRVLPDLGPWSSVPIMSVQQVRTLRRCAVNECDIYAVHMYHELVVRSNDSQTFRPEGVHYLVTTWPEDRLHLPRGAKASKPCHRNQQRNQR
ncbi:hypothetical protein K466DRAFT_569926 [Polyporus arcularius HHB13444]|uniref:Uncharacterized protein n=1 Tax=Polyporus arcularius HHB13444 TaxID=1314778 RepID=A0A5C3NQY5_9APHY|nr:hypothetical protein K466DRAFT_569926 [Polyporus arcularius HHB13444]